MAHEMRRARNGVDGVLGDRARRVSYQGKQSAHSGKYAPMRGGDRTGYDRIARCVSLLLFGGLRCVVFERRCAFGGLLRRGIPASSVQLVTQEAAQ